MADSLITNLTIKSTPANTDELPINDVPGGNVDKKITVGGVRTAPITTKTANYTATDDDEVILLDPSTSAMTITLPAASGRTGKKYQFKYISSTGQPVIIDGNASETIDSLTTRTIEHYGETLEIVCDGSNWYIINAGVDILGVSTRSYLFTDFMSHQDEAGEVGGAGWTFTETGTNTALSIDGVADHPGILQLTTGATSGNDIAIHSGGSSTLNAFMSNQNFSVTWLIRIPTITTVGVRIGLGSTSTFDGMTGTGNGYAMFQFDPAVNAAWQVINAGGSAATTTTSGVTVVANTWYKLKVVFVSGNLYYYINDAFAANHTTNLPTVAANPAAGVQTNTTAARTLDIDYVEIYLRGLAR